MKKKFVAIITTILLIASMSSIASAAEAPQNMKKAIQDAKQEEHSNYKKGSLTLSDFQEISVNDPELETGTVQMALAEYSVVRDKIFPIVHKEVVYYDSENGKVLQEAQLAGVDEAVKYKESHKGETGVKLQMGLIIALLIVLPLVYFLIIVLVWEPRQYLTTKFKIANKLYYGQQQTYQ